MCGSVDSGSIVSVAGGAVSASSVRGSEIAFVCRCARQVLGIRFLTQIKSLTWRRVDVCGSVAEEAGARGVESVIVFARRTQCRAVALQRVPSCGLRA